MYLDIILIGPISAGKSTLGELLAQRLGWPQRSMDDLRWDYYSEIGYDESIAQQKREQGELLQYWKPFEAHAVVRLLEDCQQTDSPAVVDFGAGHSVYEDVALFNKVQQALSPYPNVVLLLPSPNKKETLNILSARNADMPADVQTANAFMVNHVSNAELAKLTIYTNQKTPEESCDEILQKVQLPQT